MTMGSFFGCEEAEEGIAGLRNRGLEGWDWGGNATVMLM